MLPVFVLEAACSSSEKHREEIAYISGPSSLQQQDLLYWIRSAAHNTERGAKKHTFKHQKPTYTFTLHTHTHTPTQTHTHTHTQSLSYFD